MMSTASAGLLAASTVLTEDLLPRAARRQAVEPADQPPVYPVDGHCRTGYRAGGVSGVISALTLAYNLRAAGAIDRRDFLETRHYKAPSPA